MLQDFIITILWSLSPFGEAKVGIPYGLLKDLNPFLVFGAALAANICVFPIMIFFLDTFNKLFLRWRWYKTSALWVAQRAKKGSKEKLQKYGYWGLAMFVMVPLPGTGVYAGTILAYILRMNKKRAFMANVVGITLSSVIVWSVTFFGLGLI